MAGEALFELVGAAIDTVAGAPVSRKSRVGRILFWMLVVLFVPAWIYFGWFDG